MFLSTRFFLDFSWCFECWSSPPVFSNFELSKEFPKRDNEKTILKINIKSSVFVRQAQICNPDLKPAESTNTNFGLIYGNNGNRVSFDYWEIDFENRIEGQSAQALLSEDPFGPSITRNELGDLIGVTTTYFNEESTVLSGIDYGLSTVNSFLNGEVELIKINDLICLIN